MIRCPGTTYSGSTLEAVAPTPEYYGSATAVCDGCKRRVRMNGRRLPLHYLDVTIHDVQLAE
jgi:hypothetical protein